MKKALLTILTASMFLGGMSTVALAQSKNSPIKDYVCPVTYKVPQNTEEEYRTLHQPGGQLNTPAPTEKEKGTPAGTEGGRKTSGKCEKHGNQGQCEKEKGKCRARDKVTIEKVIVEDFKISREKLDKALSEGKCYGDVLKENNIDYNTFKQKYLEMRFKEIDEKVSQGTMTKERAEDFKNKIKDHVNKNPNDHN